MFRLRVLLLVVTAYAATASAAPWLPGGGAIAARTNGVAPLAVFFDASAATSDVSTLPFHELDYAWDFGDPHAGVWSTDGRRRSVAKGPVAAHVFLTAGIYTVTLTVRDAAGGIATRAIPITVTDTDAAFPGTNTVCVSATGDFAGAPAGALHVTTSSFSAAQPYIRQGVRILFRRGETWVATSRLTINTPGPGMVGSFGEGAAPRIVASNDVSFFRFSDRVPNCDDWRVADFELDGAGRAGSGACGAGGTSTRILLLRIAAHDVHSGFSIEDSVLNYNNSHGYPGHTLHDQIAIADCSVVRVIGGAGGTASYLSAQRFSLQGCAMHDSTSAEHVTRMPWIKTGVIAHNDMSMQSRTKHLIKLHAPGYTNAGLGYMQYTERVVMSDNRFLGNADWSVTPGPQNALCDERVRDVIIERNHFIHNTNVSISLVIWACQVTVRNNIFDTTYGKGRWCIEVTRRGVEPAPTDVRIYNNTAYTGADGTLLVRIRDMSTNIAVMNNLVAAPPGGSAVVNNGTGVGYVASHNLPTLSPGFVAATPVAPADFMLLPSSPAVNAGTAIPVFDDYFLNGRPFADTNDLGACEFVPEPCLMFALAVSTALGARGLNPRGRVTRTTT